MSSITKQKADLKELISDRVEEVFLTSEPEAQLGMLVRLVGLLLGKMTLKELKEWHYILYIARYVLTEDDKPPSY